MAESSDKDQVVTPWEAKAGKGQSSINYDKLISKWRSLSKVYVRIDLPSTIWKC